MKNLNNLLLAATIVILITLVNSCDVSNVSKLSFPIIINAEISDSNKFLSNTERFSGLEDLSDYQSYEDNKELISDINVLHFNFWFKDFIYDDTLELDEIVIDTVKFSIQFTNDNGVPVKGESYLLTDLVNVNIDDYYRVAHHITFVDGESGVFINKALKEYEKFYFIVKFGNIIVEDSTGEIDERNLFVEKYSARMDITTKIQTE